jgi:hypothetical protein
MFATREKRSELEEAINCILLISINDLKSLKIWRASLVRSAIYRYVIESSIFLRK